MKARELLYSVGIKPSPREYSYDIDSMTLPSYGTVQYAQWRHPKMRPMRFRDAEIDALREFLHEGDVAIDVGAHCGDTTVPMGLAVGKTGRVFALEPNVYVYKILLANVALNVDRFPITPLMCAATEEDAELEFEYSDPGFCNGGQFGGVSSRRHAHFFKLKVQGINVERYLEEHHPETVDRVRYIKIDTEGHDLDVARSMRGLLERNHPFVRSEIYHQSSREDRQTYYDFLRELGYTIHRFESETHYKGPELSAEDMQQAKTFDIFAVPPKA
jgi:FkbM family methyltransferase